MMAQNVNGNLKKTSDLNSINNYLKETLIFLNIDEKDFEIFNKLVNESHSIYFLVGGSNLYTSNDYADKFSKMEKGDCCWYSKT